MGTSTVEIYSAWHRQAFYIGIVALVLGLATIGLALFAAGELRRRNLAEKRLKALATTDGLTGLSNRRTFDHSLQKEWSRAARQGKSLAVLMIDADHFKSYNDRCGHQAGDKALIAIARAIAANVRADLDVSARYGGEEFAVLLAGASLHEAFRVAESIRRSVVAVDPRDPTGLSCPTVSVGISSCVPSEASRADELVAAADRALYAAKGKGRNRTTAEQIQFQASKVAVAA